MPTADPHHTTHDHGQAGVLLSILVPAWNEADNMQPLIDEVASVMAALDEPYELIVLDDGSTDGTDARVAQMMPGRPWLRLLRRDDNAGKSAGMLAAIGAARGRFIATLDADMQNDPADLLPMLEILRRGEADFVQGDRSAMRQDAWVRKAGTAVGRAVRRWVLGDTVRDTGCATRMMTRDIARGLPMQYEGMHRFLPAYAALMGARIVERPVNHRSRHSGTSKYGLGVLSRAGVGLRDTLAVHWMRSRYRAVSSVREVTHEQDASELERA